MYQLNYFKYHMKEEINLYIHVVKQTRRIIQSLMEGSAHRMVATEKQGSRALILPAMRHRDRALLVMLYAFFDPVSCRRQPAKRSNNGAYYT